MIELGSPRKQLFKEPRKSVGSRPNETTVVQLSAFQENFDQRIRYLVNKQRKHKQTDVLNIKNKADTSFERLRPFSSKNQGIFQSIRRSTEDDPKASNRSIVNISSISEYNFLNNERKACGAGLGGTGAKRAESFGKHKGFSTFIHNARPTCSHINPNYLAAFSQRSASPFSRKEGMCSRLLDMAHENKFLPAPFKKK